MSSETEICNHALLSLGAKTIQALTDDTIEGRTCLRLYRVTRDATLEAREWTFAVKRAELPKLVDPPVWGFGAKFQLPPDTLRIIEARSDQVERVAWRQMANRLEWVREGDELLTDASSPLRIRYIAQIIDTAAFSPAFERALSAHLAYEMAIPLTASRTLQSDMWELYQAKLKEAASTDGMQGRTQVIRSSKLTGVRGIGSSVPGTTV